MSDITSELRSCLTDIDITERWAKGGSYIRRQINHPILPLIESENVLITSALPYVNNIPHLGNIIGSVLSADCYARFCRLRNIQTLYICGTDEYGTATETKALEEGISCELICKKYHDIHKKVYDWFNISFDYFGRTTTQQQTSIAQDIFHKLHKNDCFIEDSIDQLYCDICDRYLADRFVEGICPLCAYPDARGDQCDGCGKLINAVELIEPKCKICRMKPIVRNSTHLFLNLPKIEPQLKEFIEKSQATGTWSSNAVSITRKWIKEGLKPRCITRDLKWGTPVPLPSYGNKVFYVWFDAPIGYISITANYTEKWELWWKNRNVRLVNFMAKDNVPFHTVVFPSSLIGTGDAYTMLSDISSTEYLSYENGKFSKSRNIGVFGDNAMDSNIPSDIFRVYLLSNRPESQDTAFIWDDLISRNNSILIDNIGNFMNRSLSLLFKKFDGKIQTINLTLAETEVINKIDYILCQYIQCMQSYRLREAFTHVADISRIGNQYLQYSEPWKLKTDIPDELQRLKTILSFSINITALLSLLLHPYAPNVSDRIMSDIGLPTSQQLIPDYFVRLLQEDVTIQKPVIYFNKIDKNYAEILRQKYGKNTAEEVKCKTK